MGFGRSDYALGQITGAAQAILFFAGQLQHSQISGTSQPRSCSARRPSHGPSRRSSTSSPFRRRRSRSTQHRKERRHRRAPKIYDLTVGDIYEGPGDAAKAQHKRNKHEGVDENIMNAGPYDLNGRKNGEAVLVTRRQKTKKREVVGQVLAQLSNEKKEDWLWDRLMVSIGGLEGSHDCEGQQIEQLEQDPAAAEEATETEEEERLGKEEEEEEGEGDGDGEEEKDMEEEEEEEEENEEEKEEGKEATEEGWSIQSNAANQNVDNRCLSEEASNSACVGGDRVTERTATLEEDKMRPPRAKVDAFDFWVTHGRPTSGNGEQNGAQSEETLTAEETGDSRLEDDGIARIDESKTEAGSYPPSGIEVKTGAEQQCPSDATPTTSAPSSLSSSGHAFFSAASGTSCCSSSSSTCSGSRSLASASVERRAAQLFKGIKELNLSALYRLAMWQNRCARPCDSEGCRNRAVEPTVTLGKWRICLYEEDGDSPQRWCIDCAAKWHQECQDPCSEVYCRLIGSLMGPDDGIPSVLPDINTWGQLRRDILSYCIATGVVWKVCSSAGLQVQKRRTSAQAALAAGSSLRCAAAARPTPAISRNRRRTEAASSASAPAATARSGDGHLEKGSWYLQALQTSATETAVMTRIRKLSGTGPEHGWIQQRSPNAFPPARCATFADAADLQEVLDLEKAAFDKLLRFVVVTQGMSKLFPLDLSFQSDVSKSGDVFESSDDEPPAGS